MAALSLCRLGREFFSAGQTGIGPYAHATPSSDVIFIHDLYDRHTHVD